MDRQALQWVYNSRHLTKIKILLSHLISHRSLFGKALIALLLARLLFSLVAHLNGSNPLSPETWLRWDSEHYIRIAETGYSCNEVDQNGLNILQGNAGWFPGFPLIIRTLHNLTGINFRLLAALIPVFFCFLLFFELLSLLESSSKHLLLITLLILLPGGIYLQSGFPMSLCILSLLICIKNITRGSLAFASIGGSMAAISHPGAIMLAPACILWSFWPLQLGKVYRSLTVSGALLISTMLVHKYIDTQTGFEHSYFRVQSGFGSNKMQNPLFVAYDKIRQFDIERFKSVFLSPSFILTDGDGRTLTAERNAAGQHVLRVSMSRYNFRQLFFLVGNSEAGAIFGNELNLFIHIPVNPGPVELVNNFSQNDLLFQQEEFDQSVVLKTAQGLYLRIDQDALLRADASTPEKATRFKKHYIFPGLSRVRHEFIALHLIVSALLTALAALVLCKGNPLQRLLATYLISCWLASLSAGAAINHIRSDTFLAPMLAGLAPLPAALIYPIILVLLVLCVGSTACFFQGLLF